MKHVLSVVTGVAMLAASLALAVASAAPAGAALTTPDFTVCPAIGVATQCEVVIVINASGPPTVYNNPTTGLGIFDGQEDALIGVQNVSGQTIPNLPLTGSAAPFGFDGDGICPVECSYSAPTGYEGPGTSFSVSDPNNGTVVFAGGLADQQSAYFGLEGTVSSSSLVVQPPLQPSGVNVTTTPPYSGPVATFHDPGSPSPVSGYTASIDWGDGSALDTGVVTGSSPDFVVSGTHTFASTGTKSVTVSIARTPFVPVQAISTFKVVTACTGNCSITIPGVETSQVVAPGGGTVTLSVGPVPGFSCGTTDPFLHAPLVTTLTSTGTTKLKFWALTIDKSQVGTHKATDYHICYGGGVAFTDLYGNAVPAGGSGLLRWCLFPQGDPRNRVPCQLASVKLNGNVYEAAVLPGGDPRGW